MCTHGLQLLSLTSMHQSNPAISRPKINLSRLAWETPLASLDFSLERWQNLYSSTALQPAYAIRQPLVNIPSLRLQLDAKVPIPYAALSIHTVPASRHDILEEEAQWKQHTKSDRKTIRLLCFCSWVLRLMRTKRSPCTDHLLLVHFPWLTERVNQISHF